MALAGHRVNPAFVISILADGRVTLRCMPSNDRAAGADPIGTSALAEFAVVGSLLFLASCGAVGTPVDLPGVDGMMNGGVDGGGITGARPANPATLIPPSPASMQTAGRRVIYSYAGLTPPQSLLDAISAGQAAGVIFFGQNISDASQIAAVIQQLRQAQQSNPAIPPLLLMTDQEGGQVRRLPGEPLLSEKQIGASSDPVGQATLAGTGAGQNLKGVGMNLNLAPVLDVYYNSGNFIDQYQRSYSNDPTIVGECAKAFISAQQATGVAATAKHFPGLGSATTSQNTDAGPVTLTVSSSQLRTVDEVPYPQAITAGVKIVMVSWATYPSLDPNLPAGLSSVVVQSELRKQVGFQGVTMTDALEAGALQAYGTTGQRAVMAAAAGLDLILCSGRDVTQGQDATAALASALESGQLDSVTFSAAVQRVTALRNSLF
jgi:beta-N-acetylhexosaminidase